MTNRPNVLTLACGTALLLGCIFASTPAAAAGSACTIDLVMTQGGERVVHSDCIESTGAPEAQVTGLCSDLVEMGESMVGMDMGNGDAIEGVTMDRLAACPGDAQARCSDFMGQDLVVHYSGRSAAELETMSSACTASGGRWND